MLPQEVADLGRGELLGMKAPIGFYAPAQIRAVPRREAMSPGREPQETKHLFLAHLYFLLTAEEEGGWSEVLGAGLA
jgi:hypothetical protein